MSPFLRKTVLKVSALSRDIKDQSISDEDAIHELRLAIKQLRSVYRVLENRGGRKTLQPLRSELRGIARRLAKYRSADVAVETAKKIQAKVPAPAADFYGKFMAEVERRRRSLTGDSRRADLKAAVTALKTLLTKTSHQAASQVSEDDWLHGIDRTLKRARKSLRRCAKSGAAAEEFHRLRKRLKDLQYQFILLQTTAQPQRYKKSLEKVKAAGQTIGKAQDFADLLAMVQSFDRGKKHARQPLLRYIEKRRKKALDQSLRKSRQALKT